MSCVLPSTAGPWAGAPSSLPVQPAVGLTDGRGRLRLAQVAGQSAVRDAASHHAGLDLVQVVGLSGGLGLQEADVGLVASLLLGGRTAETQTPTWLSHLGTFKHDKMLDPGPYLISEVVLFESELLPLAAFGLDLGRVFAVLLQLQAHLLQLALMTPQLILLSQSHTGETHENSP